MCPQGKLYKHKKEWPLSVTASCCVGGAAVNMSVMVHGSMSALYLHSQGNISITEKSYRWTRQVEIGCKIRWAHVKACLYLQLHHLRSFWKVRGASVSPWFPQSSLRWTSSLWGTHRTLLTNTKFHIDRMSIYFYISKTSSFGLVT